MKNIYETFIPQIIVKDKRYETKEAMAEGLELSQMLIKEEDAVYLQLKLKNNSVENIHLDKFNWHRSGNHGDFLNRPKLLLYLEGWQMASPCGVRKYGDFDYKYNPDYLKYAVAEPQDYSELPNHFRAENMIMFQDSGSEETLLAGFVTSGNQFGHFKWSLQRMEWQIWTFAEIGRAHV